MNPEGIGAIAVMVVMGCLMAWSLLRSPRTPPNDLPPLLLDVYSLNIDNERRVVFSGTRNDGRQVTFLLDPRHAHILSDELVQASAKARKRKTDDAGPPAFPQPV